ncbi:MAG: class I SAM-dependent methyltransferase [Bacillota bacterium]|nr:class I SAM-dependent methyltransferase [Bacillota bacterium]MDP4154171.1 class I SAM-dependent methyltransferase [Bacillota bacterium]
MKCFNAYESNDVRKVLGETMRPGGFSLTDAAANFFQLSEDHDVLDLGCGMGATIGYLYESRNIKAVGIDPSETLLDLAKKEHINADFVVGTGENIPFEPGKFDAVFAECTLSLMDDLDRTLEEVRRVLNQSGWFVITDVYARNHASLADLEKMSVNSCMRGLHDLDLLKQKLEGLGFKILHLEDCSQLLKELFVKIVFSYGSMDVFWNLSADDCTDGCKFQEMLKRCKPGYFLMIAKKGEFNHG